MARKIVLFRFFPMENLSTLAERANIAFKNEPGFIHCSVDTESPNTLRYSFDSPIDAEKSKFNREVQGSLFQMRIEGSDLLEVRN
jgi:hypothetical protein